MFRNILCKGSRCLKLDAWTDGLTNKSKNLIKISPQKQTWMLNNKPTQPNQVSYDPSVLRQLGEKVKHDNRYKWLPFGTIKQVLKLKINNKNRSRKSHTAKCFKQTGVTKSNLITIKRSSHKPDSNIIFSICNIQSLKHKELQVSELINDYALDFLVVTKTWLNAKQDQWKDRTILNRDGLIMLTTDRTNRDRGGGIALIYKSKYRATTITKGNRPTFEFATWELKLKNSTLVVHGIYHPPPSLRNKTTNLAFIEDFLEFASNTLLEHQNSVYIGDFNLHISKDDANPAIFNDSIEAMGLYQHVGFHRHQGVNILDLVISDIHQQMTIVSTAPGPFLSNHHAIIGTLNIKKFKPSYAKIKVRQIHKITDNQWLDEIDANNLDLTDKLDTLNKTLTTELTRVLNTLAPEKECKVNLRTKRPWYDADLKEHKCQVRKLEKKWLKYKNEGCHIAFKKCHNSYYGKLNAKKKSVLQSKCQDCGKDLRKIHALMTNPTSKQCERKLPQAKSNQDLAQEFATFFQNKIKNIRDTLSDKPHFTTVRNDSPSLRCFAPMMEQQVIKTICSLKSKSCELDPIPTTIFLKLLEELALLITKIVSVSLTQAEFSTDWKTEVVRPLLKKIGLELIHANFRLVSNLSFLSKIV